MLSGGKTESRRPHEAKAFGAQEVGYMDNAGIGADDELGSGDEVTTFDQGEPSDEVGYVGPTLGEDFTKTVVFTT